MKKVLSPQDQVEHDKLQRNTNVDRISMEFDKLNNQW